MLFLDSGASLWDGLLEAAAQAAQTIGVLLLIFSTVFALLNCFFGYQLKKLWITLLGFAIGFVAGLVPCLIWVHSDAVVGIAVAVGLVVGVLFALVAFRCYKAGVFIWVAFLTFANIAGLFDGNLEWLGIVLGVLAGIAVGVLSLRYLRPVCIFSTAVNGGILASQNVLTLCKIEQTWVVAAAGIALAALGILVQLRLTRPKKS